MGSVVVAASNAVWRRRVPLFIWPQQKQGPSGGVTYVLTGTGIGACELLGAGDKEEGYAEALDDGWDDACEDGAGSIGGWDDGWADGWAEG
jgi:hypothetical protein